MDQAAKKEAVARAAIDSIRDDLSRDAVIGVGTGSTANCFIDLLGGLREHFAGAVASSEVTAARLQEQGIRVLDLNDVDGLPVYVDGADEADRKLNLIKGGGGALTREKIVAATAERFVCIVDESKCVAQLGAFPLPLEVLAMAEALVRRQIAQLGGTATRREGFVTDNGNLILDVAGLDLSDPPAVEQRLNNFVGIVCNGLFAQRRAEELLIGTDHGVEHRGPGGARQL